MTRVALSGLDKALESHQTQETTPPQYGRHQQGRIDALMATDIPPNTIVDKARVNQEVKEPVVKMLQFSKVLVNTNIY